MVDGVINDKVEVFIIRIMIVRFLYLMSIWLCTSIYSKLFIISMWNQFTANYLSKACKILHFFFIWGKFGFRLIVLKKNIQEYYRYFFKVKKNPSLIGIRL